MYWKNFVLLVSVAIAIALIKRLRGDRKNAQTVASSHIRTAAYAKFEYNYCAVYILMAAGDWFQGPYVYALYRTYGFTLRDIMFLFVTGFGSSMVVGTVIGSLADRYGRKRMSMVYAILYSMGCFTKHFAVYKLLLVGRVLCGVSTSLLNSVFETWLVCEHGRRRFPPELLSKTLSLVAFLNSISAIGTGLIAEYATEQIALAPAGLDHAFIGGNTVPFDLAVLCFAFGTILVSCTWKENYGNSNSISRDGTSISSSFGRAINQIANNRSLLYCGILQAVFEGAMYCFIFVWTPALATFLDGEVKPYGIIFASFMTGCMIGTQFFGVVSPYFAATELAVLVSGFATFALFVSCAGLVWNSEQLVFGGFVLFEISIGMYFPTIGTLKSDLVPEETRSTIYNIFRVPLNMVVLVVLVGNFGVNLTLQGCIGLLIVATVSALAMHRHGVRNGIGHPKPTTTSKLV